MKFRWLIAIAATFPLTVLHAQPVDVAKSRITATFSQMSVPVEATFKRFKADVNYDPAAPEKTTATLQLDIASFDLGDPEYNSEVQKPEWFDAKKFAQATFVTQSVRSLAKDRLEVRGTLTIKGRAQPVVVTIGVKELGVKQTGTLREFSGLLPIKRLAFHIGEGEWAATDMVADDVMIKFSVVTAAQ